MTALAVACLALYGAGLTSTLSPCVLPLVPGYLGVLGHGGGRDGRRVGVVIFAAGAALTFVALGGVVSAVGVGVAGTALWSQRLAGWTLVALGVVMVLGQRGIVGRELRLVRCLPTRPGWQALVLGVGCGAAWSPCVGPLLGVALTAAGSSGSVGRGSLLLASFAVGVLTPFVGLALVPVTVRPPARLAAMGRRLPVVASAATIVLGLVLAAGWYDGVVARLLVSGPGPPAARSTSISSGRWPG